MSDQTIQQILDADTGDSSLIHNLAKRGCELEEALKNVRDQKELAEIKTLVQIREIIGDPLGRLMQDELVEKVREMRKENDRLQMELDASCNAEELRQVREENKRLKERIAETIGWCDERRNAPDWTTLTMIQDRLRGILEGQV